MPILVSKKDHCAALTAGGKPCLAYPIHGHKHCIFHLPPDERQDLLAKRTSPANMIAILERQLREVARDKKSSILARSFEMRSLIAQIQALQDPQPQKKEDEGKDAVQKIREEIA